MAKNRDNKEEDTFEAQPEMVVVEEVMPVAVAQAPVKPRKLLTFEQWAARKGFKKHHIGGIRAFIADANRNRPFEEWDLAAKGY